MEYLEKYNAMKFAIQECHNIDEVKLIRDKAEAYRYAIIQAKESPEWIRQAEEIKLRAERKAGELLKEQVRKPEEGRPEEGSEALTLIDMGIRKDQSSNWQRIADIPEEKFEEYIQKEKDITTSGAVKLAVKIQRESEPKIILLPPEGKYNVIYIDIPWKYDVDLSKGATRSPENNYPVMDLGDIKEFGKKVKEISHTNCIMFMWITAPKLNWMNDVLEAFGFEYKTNLIWDKIKPNMGHYSSVRHEILIIAGKGTCSPTCDGKTIQSVDSVQSIEKSTRHSEKPEEFIDIIDKLYPDYKKIELFARNNKKRLNWTYWGNEANL